LVFAVNTQNEFQLRLFQSVELRERARNISETVVVESIQFADKITMRHDEAYFETLRLKKPTTEPSSAAIAGAWGALRRVYEAPTPNAKIVRDRYSLPGRNMVDGNCGWFGESGKCCVSRQNANRCW